MTISNEWHVHGRNYGVAVAYARLTDRVLFENQLDSREKIIAFLKKCDDFNSMKQYCTFVEIISCEQTTSYSAPLCLGRDKYFMFVDLRGVQPRSEAEFTVALGGKNLDDQALYVRISMEWEYEKFRRGDAFLKDAIAPNNRLDWNHLQAEPVLLKTVNSANQVVENSGWSGDHLMRISEKDGCCLSIVSKRPIAEGSIFLVGFSSGAQNEIAFQSMLVVEKEKKNWSDWKRMLYDKLELLRTRVTGKYRFSWNIVKNENENFKIRSIKRYSQYTSDNKRKESEEANRG